MLGYLTKRLGYYAILLVVAVGLSYGLASSALSPRGYFQGRQPPPSKAAVERQLDHLGVNDHDPLPARFGAWANGVAHGDFGQTIDDTPVNDEIGRRIGVSLRLLVAGTIIGTGVGVLLGAWSAVRQYRFSDRALTLFSFLIMSMPTFLIAVLLKLGATWVNQTAGTNLINFTGEKSPGLTGGFLTLLQDRAVHLILPTLAIGLTMIATYSRYQRNTMLDVLGSDYLRTAQAKGLTRTKALLKHGLRTALIPMSTFFAYGFLGLLTGATFTEKIFGWNGMGSWFIDSINKADVNSVVAFSLFAAVMVLLSGLVADVLHAALDPRVRHG